MAVKAEKGYLVIAVNSKTCDYVGMARQLSRSIKNHHPNAMTCLVTDALDKFSEFDFVEKLPNGNFGGFYNDWQAWSASPFRETIKLEADMLITSEIDHWWPMLRNRDVVISTGARDFYDQQATSRYYRNIFDSNNLPDVYNAITYWRISKTAQYFWQVVSLIFNNWDQYKTLIKFAPEKPDTDLVYAMSARIVGEELVTLPKHISYPKIVHMKQHVIPTHSRDWSKELVWEKIDNSLRINTVAQWGCFHYYTKGWKP